MLLEGLYPFSNPVSLFGVPLRGMLFSQILMSLGSPLCSFLS